MRIAVAIAVLAAACGGRDDLDGRRTPVRGLPERAPAYELPVEPGRAPVYDLYDNRVSASVHVDEALHIDCGSPDFAKYVEGGYRSPWHLGRRVDGRAAALIDGLAGELYFPLDADPGGVYRAPDGGVRLAFYARAAAADQLVSVFLNEHRLRDVQLPTAEWSWYGVDAPAAALVEGENKLRFYFKRTDELDGVRTAAAFARIVVGGRRPIPGKRPSSPVRGERVELAGGAMAAITAERASRLSFYVAVPAARPALQLALAGSGGAAVHVDGEPVWTGTAGDDWAPVAIDLAAAAGRVARIDLVADGTAHWGRPRLIADDASPEPEAKRTLPDHVIVWTVSSLRADRLAGPAAAAPAFAKLASEGATYRRLIAPAPAPGSAHVALLTGRYPSGASVPKGAVTLGARFRAAGFATALVSGNGFVNDEEGYAQGFDHYINPMRLRRPHGARVLWQEARKFLARQDGRRSFVYIATVEPHLPYTPSADSLEARWDGPPIRFEPARTAELSAAVAAGTEKLTADERAWVEALYDAEVRDADAALAAMRADLAKLELAGRTAVVLVGDHGEELFERGQFGHGATLYQEVLATPLVIWFPDGVAPKTVESVVDAVDLYPTVLDLAGIGANPEAQGASLLPVGEQRRGSPAFAHLPGRGRAMVMGRYKLIVPHVGIHELYDLAADPGERDNLMGSLPNVERMLRNVFGLRVAYEAAWQRRRWGSAASLTGAFASDHGL